MKYVHVQLIVDCGEDVTDDELTSGLTVELLGLTVVRHVTDGNKSAVIDEIEEMRVVA